MARTRKPDMLATLSLTDDMPVLPDVVKHMLNKLPTYADIVEMSITTSAAQSLHAALPSTTPPQYHGRNSHTPCHA